MNKIYNVIWNSTLGMWTVASELARGKIKSSAKSTDKPILSSLGLTLMMGFGITGNAFAVDLVDTWTTKNNNYQGAYVIKNGDVVDITGPSKFAGGDSSGYISLTLQQAIDQGYASGDMLTDLLYVNTGNKSTAVTVNDPVLGPVSFNVYNNSNFSQRAAGSDAAEKVMVLDPKGADFFYNTRFVTVDKTGGIANFYSDAEIKGSFKSTQLAYADGRGTTESTINWTSSNNIAMYAAASASAGSTIQNKSVDSYVYAGTFTAYDGSSHTVTSLQELKDYNSWLISELQKNNGLKTADYEAEFSKATVKSSHDYSIDTTKGGQIDPTPYLATPGTRAVMYGIGRYATVRLAEGATITGYAPGSGVILTNGGAYGINNGTIDVLGIAMYSVLGGVSINNGTLMVWNPDAVGGTSGRGVGIQGANSGTLLTNNGTINIRPWNNARNTPLGNNVGIELSDGAAAFNYGVINLTATPIQNDSVSATIGVNVLGGGSTFTNDGKITIGVDQAGNNIHSAPDSIAIRMTSSSGRVENAGEILMSESVQGAFGFSAKDAGVLNAINSGTININGQDGSGSASVQNVGMFASASSGLSNTGTINLNGINGVGIKAVKQGAITSSGTINVKGADASSGLRNYGGWAEGAGSKLNISGEVNLSGDGAIGLHARDGSQIDLSGNGAVKFVNGTNQIGFYIYGANSVINNTGKGVMDVSTDNSTLFRVADGANFLGSADASSALTASGKESVAVVTTGKSAEFKSGGMTINLTGEGATGVLIEGGAKGDIASNASIQLNEASAIAGIADGDGRDINGVITNPKDRTTSLKASAQLNSDKDKVTGYIARNGATLDNAGNIAFTGRNTVGIQVQDGSVGENTGSITLQDGGVGLIASSDNLQTTINNTGSLILKGGTNANRTKGIQASGDAVTVNMTAGLINMEGQGAIGVEALDGGTVNLAGTAVPKFADESTGVTDQIAFRVVGEGSSINTNVPAGTLLDASGKDSTLFRIEHGASQSGIIQLKTSGTNAKGIWATGKGTNVTASGGSDFQILGKDAQGVYITGGATGLLQQGTQVNLVGNGAVVGNVDGNEYDLSGDILATDTGSTLTNQSNISTNLNKATGFISQNQGLLVNKGTIDFSQGTENTGIKVLNGKFENSASEIKVNGVAVYVEGEASKVTSTGGKIIATDGEAAIKLGRDASLDLTGSGVGIVEGRGSAHGVLLDTGAKGLKVEGARIDVNATGATGHGIENKAEITGIQLSDTTINVADGIAVRTSATLAQTNSGTINVEGGGIGLAFQTADGNITQNNLDMSDSADLIINLEGTGGTGILANTKDDATVKSGASVNVTKADGGAALVVNNSAKEVVQSGNLNSSSTTAAVVKAAKAKSFTNKGKIIANSETAEAMSFDGAINTVLVNDTNAKIQGVVALNGGNNNFTNKGDIKGTVSVADGNNTMLFDNGSNLTGEATLGQGNNNITLNGTAHVDTVTAGSGTNTFTIKGTGATYDLLDAGDGNNDSLIFDAATHTIDKASRLQRFEQVKLKNKSQVILNEALVLTDDGTGAGSVDIEKDSKLAVQPTAAGDFTFDPLLTGKGILFAKLDADDSAFSLSSNVGSGFEGTLQLSTSSFDLSGNNTKGITNATLKSDAGNITTVGKGKQNIGGLTLNGGKLIFGSVIPGDTVAENFIETSSAGTLDIRGTGTVQVEMPTEVVNDIPVVDTRKTLLEQDDETVLVTLVDAKGAVLGTGGQISLTDEKGDAISNAQTLDITQGNASTVVAKGTYDYQMMSSSDGISSNGLYVGYGLKELDLLGMDTEALALVARKDAKGLQTDLKAKVTGSGDLAIEAESQTISLSNGGNNYTGETLVRSGTLAMANDNVLGKTANLVIESGAAVNTGDYSQTVGALNTTEGAKVELTADSVLTISNTQRAASKSNVNGNMLKASANADGGTIDNDTLSGSGKLAIESSEVVVNGANNAFTGDVNLSGQSVVTMNGAQGLGSEGTVHFAAADDRLDIDIAPTSGSVTNLSKSLEGNGQVSLLSETDLIVSGDNQSFAGVFSIEPDASLRASEQKHLGSSVLNNEGKVYLTADKEWLLENEINGTGSLVKQGADKLIVNHNLSYSGETTVESGTMIIGDSAEASGTLSASALVLVNDGAILSGLGNIVGDVNNLGSIAALNSISGYESSEASNLNVGSLTNSGTINLAGGKLGNTLTVNGDYTGGGTLVINTELGDDSSATDKLIVTGNTSGDTGVVVNNIKGRGQQTLNGIEVVNVSGQSDGIFTLKNRAVAGAYEYYLHQNGIADENGNWYLRSELPAPTPTPVPENNDPIYRPEAGSYMANMAAAQSLFNLRLEDREGRAENSSMWLRQVGGHTRFRDGSGQLHNQTNRYVVQGGGEVFGTQFAENDRFGVGIMAGYGNASTNTTSNRSDYSSRGKVDGYNAGVYATWYQDAKTLNGVYVDSWVNYSWLDAEVHGEQLNSESYDINGASASLESGYRLPIYQGQNGDVFITPQAQVIWNGLKADEHTERNGTRVKSNGSDNLQTRMGLKISRDGASDGDKGTDKLFTVYAEANWIYNSKLAGASLDYEDVKQAGSRNIGELKLGTEGQVNKNLNLWTNVAQQLGDTGYSDTSVNIGVKYRF
ncbi:autotransporter outer membrane beta-barrel domain-containing protein [Budviciaceae bacterium BWR-B9]|uniref:Autotransporter outer membrane beta-barrel domain-containing protein n=1 Tax=Limnobaculum allomyrinae TaxID=2791986 RepID=A0ABS1IR13_9GAMM|nr:MULTISPECIES: autotransporter outer membrane beta-barrel domain-containing protein [Limnobaculum]MBK5144203.1 autotransporter outer membrane beta-barrel domain-containing protein [Limnobaculum allomyrinae]MBV7692053.1 autotransporter outer membrane beta-barrel domain-containing protein [Limnobaculum sp. M2-1]